MRDLRVLAAYASLKSLEETIPVAEQALWAQIAGEVFDYMYVDQPAQDELLILEKDIKIEARRASPPEGDEARRTPSMPYRAQAQPTPP